jgi:hypothetical protein
MTELEIHLENCYGIRRFKHKFNFGQSKTHLVYAPNGVMKSSLALTLEDIAEGRVSKDRIFSHRVNHREVKVDGTDIDKDEIFVIQRMKSAEFKEASTILANEKLKNEYDTINLKLNESKNEFLKKFSHYLELKHLKSKVKSHRFLSKTCLKCLKPMTQKLMTYKNQSTQISSIQKYSMTNQ